MKRVISILSLIAAVVGAGATSSWAFTPGQKSVITAGTTTGGVRVSTFSLALVNAANPALGAGSIAWSGVDPAITSWKLADSLVRLNYNVTDVGGGIQIYTDNVNAAGTA